MMMKPTEHSHARAYLQLHIAVVLFGFTAILGELIQLPGMVLTWYRLIFTLISLCLFPGIFRSVLRIPVKDLYYILGIGVLLAIHWASFFESIKYANVSITLSGLASTAFFTSLIEPIAFKRKISWPDVLLALGVILGFIFIFGFIPAKYLTGLIIAIASAVVIAIASVMNKAVVEKYNVFAITLVQFASGWLFLSLMMPLYLRTFSSSYFLPGWKDLAYLLILALLCTTFAYTLFMKALRQLTAFVTTLTINLEPVYGILMAFLFFREDKQLNSGFYTGAGIIVLILFLHPVINKYIKKYER